MKGSPGKRVLMLLENNAYPQDGRVRREALTLTQAGFQVSVIAPKSQAQPAREVVDGVYVYRYPAAPDGEGILGYFWEYGYSMAAAFFLSLVVLFQRGFDILHAHNPPDTFSLLAALYKPFGKHFVFDHHDLSPEMYCARFEGQGKQSIYKALLFFEKLTFRLADHVIATNESYKQVAVRRGGLRPDAVTVVRNGPELDRVQPVSPDPALRARANTILGYVGVMGYQDGLDYLLRALSHLVNDLGRTDFYCVLVGKGDALQDLQTQASGLGLDPYVWFTGRVSDEDLMRYLSTTDICLDPDPKNPFTDRSSMIKMSEYMALGKPVVAFDLTEHRVTAQEAALYARPNDELDFARKIEALMDDPEARRRMGELGRARARHDLSWENQEKYLIDAYSNLLKPKRFWAKFHHDWPVMRMKLIHRWLHLKKRLYQRRKYQPGIPKQVVFVVGCQRSGTNLTKRIFDHDMSAQVYPEVSELSSQDAPKKLRLNPLPSIKQVFDQQRAPLIILKPLVESQNTLELLGFFPGSKAIWLYRNYKDVAASHVTKWGGENSIYDLRAIVDRLSDNWRYEKVSDELREVVVSHFSDDMPDYDAAALYWYVRNRLFFDLQLDQHPDVLLCKYENLAYKPEPTIRKIYRFIGREFPGNGIINEVHAGSVRKGRDIPLSPAIEKLCGDLLEKLDAAWTATNGAAKPWNIQLPEQIQEEPLMAHKE